LLRCRVQRLFYIQIGDLVVVSSKSLESIEPDGVVPKFSYIGLGSKVGGQMLVVLYRIYDINL
jgi:hypothetical protein